MQPHHPAAASPPVVSVIIAARDAAPTLPETLASLRAQTFAAWEAIVVDDASTDGTADIIASCRHADDRFRSLRVEATAGGVSAARNAGLCAARGGWVVFLDADDWIAPRHLERLLARVERRPDAGVAFCGFRRVLPAGAQLTEKRGMSMNFPAALERAPFALLAGRCPLAIHAVLVRRQIVIDAGGFDVGLCHHEDWDLWLRVARMGATFVGVPEALAFYRVRPGSASRDLARHAEAAGTIFGRARRPDARPAYVDPRHAAGAASDDVARASASFTLFLAGVAAGSGVSAGAVLDAPARWPDAGVAAGAWPTPEAAAGTIVSGLALGALRPHGEIAGAWPAVAPHVAEICERFSAATAGGKVAERRCFAAVELAVLRAAPLDEPRVLTRVQGFRVSLAAPLPELIPAAGVEAVYVRITSGRAVIDDLVVVTSSALAPVQLARILVARWGVAEARRRRHLPALMAAAASSSSALASVSAQITAGAAVTATVPVLMYHRIAAEGPSALARWRLHPHAFEQQLGWLRQHEYRAITSVELAAALRDGRPLTGRPVLLTFDDGYRDFRDTAWPLMRRYDLRPELFVVTDKVGGAADWNAEHGPPAPLLTWQEIAEVQRQGVVIGSHLATHRHLEGEPMSTLVDEAARSRFTLETRLQTEVRSVALPFGLWDQRLERALASSGYRIGFTAGGGRAAIGMPPLTLPRIEVLGSDDLAAFASKLSEGATPGRTARAAGRHAARPLVAGVAS